MLLDTHQPKLTTPTSPTIPTKEPQKKILRKHGLKSSTKVRFCKRVHAREIPHLNDISEQQVRTTWYSKEEFSDIKSDRKLAVKRQSLGFFLELDTCEELCFRGLEKRTREGSILKKTNRLSGIEAVLQEQSRQSLLGIYSPDDVAQVYIDTVFRARRAAHIKGLSDAREASEGSIKEEVQQVDKSCGQKIKINEIMMSLNADFKVTKSKSSRF